METIDYRNFTIEIERDECAVNPMEDYETCPLLVAHCDGPRGYWIKEYNGASLNAPELTREQIKQHAGELCALTGYRTLLELCIKEGREAIYDYNNNYNDATEWVNYALASWLDGENTSDKLDALVTLYGFAGIVAISEARTGYNQGDYFLALVIAPPEWLSETGIKPDNIQRALNGVLDNYAAYCFGDCWYYTIEDANGETIDSLAGFFGEYGSVDWERMLDMARETIDYHIRETRRARLARIKQLIKARAPLAVRAQLLAAV